MVFEPVLSTNSTLESVKGLHSMGEIECFSFVNMQNIPKIRRKVGPFEPFCFFFIVSPLKDLLKSCLSKERISPFENWTPPSGPWPALRPLWLARPPRGSQAPLTKAVTIFCWSKLPARHICISNKAGPSSCSYDPAPHKTNVLAS